MCICIFIKRRQSSSVFPFSFYSRTFTVQSSASDPSCWQTHTFPRTLENKGSVLCFSSIPVPSLLQCLTPVEATLTPTKMADRPLTSWTPLSTDIYTTFAAWSCVVSPLILKITQAQLDGKKKKKDSPKYCFQFTLHLLSHICLCLYVSLVGIVIFILEIRSTGLPFWNDQVWSKNKKLAVHSKHWVKEC